MPKTRHFNGYGALLGHRSHSGVRPTTHGVTCAGFDQTREETMTTIIRPIATNIAASVCAGLALFASASSAAPQGYDQQARPIRCESGDGRARACPTPWRGQSRLSRQLSDTRCIEGRTWASRPGQVSVNGGCRGEFIAQRDVGPPIGAGNIRCESDDGRPRTCVTPWRGRSQVVRQLSDTSCVEGRNWQARNGQVTVSNGCRAEFAQTSGGIGPPVGGGSTIRCESDDGRARSCPTPWRGSSQLVRQISGSRCVEGSTWQSRGGQVTVSGGCRGEFAEGRRGDRPPIGGDNGSGGTLRCESDDGRARTCAVPWRGSSRLLRQLSDTACVEGRTWFARGGQVTVSGGCRGEFGQR